MTLTATGAALRLRLVAESERALDGLVAQLDRRLATTGSREGLAVVWR